MVRRTAGALLAPCAVLLLQACSSFVLHDETRAKLAADTKQSYADAKIPGVIESDRKNLEAMLAAEIEVVRENARYEVDYALLALANNTTPMGGTYVSAKVRIKELGAPGIADLRAIRDRLIDLERLWKRVDNDVKALNALNVAATCVKQFPPKPRVPDGLPESERADIETEYAKFAGDCNALLKLQEDPSGGKLGAAYLEWDEAQAKLRSEVSRQKVEADALRKAKQEYEKKVKEAGDPSKVSAALAKDISDKARHYAELVEKAKGLDKGLEREPFIEALVELLTAAAGGSVDPKDPALQGAVAVARQIPSLAGDIAALEQQRKAPPVSGLLIELAHQTLQAEMAKKRVALAQERVDILKVKYEIYQEAAKRWLRFFDAMCTYAVLGAGRQHPRDKCDGFGVEKSEPKISDADQKKRAPEFVIACTYDGKPLEGCLLNLPWKTQLRANADAEIRRKLYEGLAAYVQAITLQARPLEQSFREIDVRHREALLAKQTAIEQWDNLVSVPLEQLEAYYKAGVKPAELADLIVKALGFTAIAIGVTQ